MTDKANSWAISTKKSYHRLVWWGLKSHRRSLGLAGEILYNSWRIVIGIALVDPERTDCRAKAACFARESDQLQRSDLRPWSVGLSRGTSFHMWSSWSFTASVSGLAMKGDSRKLIYNLPDINEFDTYKLPPRPSAIGVKTYWILGSELCCKRILRD